MTRRWWVAIVLGVGPAVPAAAQGAPVGTGPGTEFGIVGGTNIATYDGSAGFPSHRRAGPILGLFTRWGTARPLGVEADLAFVQDGATLAVDPSANGFDQVRYVQLPVLARLQFFRSSSLRPYVSGGPYAALRLGCSARRPVETTPVKDACGEATSSFKKFDAGLMFGAGLDFNRLSVGTQYQLGLRSVGASALVDAKNRGLGFTIGYAVKKW